jgi:hypothetical protein
MRSARNGTFGQQWNLSSHQHPTLVGCAQTRDQETVLTVSRIEMIVKRQKLNLWERLYLPAIIGGFKVTLRHFF